MRTEVEMGTGHSKEEQVCLKVAIQRLSKVELSYIDKIFKELSFLSHRRRRRPNQENNMAEQRYICKQIGLPNFLGECLFAAFDRDQNATIDVEEFLSGMALTLFAWTC